MKIKSEKELPMSKIEKLTPEQEKRLESYLAEWLKVGRSTAPIDETKTKEVLTDFYRRIGKAAPRFLVFDSPEQCCIGAPIFLKMVGALKTEAELKDLSTQVLNARYAQRWWSSWVAFYRLCEEIGVPYSKENSELLAQWDVLSRSCHWFFPFENWCILSRAPTVLEVDQQGRIHGGIEYADGTGVWAHHGIRMPKEAIRQPGWVTIAKIEAEENAEVRRAMIEIYGAGKYLLDSGAKQIQRDEYGVLYKKRVGNDDLVSVRVLNSTPEPDGTLTSDEALAIFGKPRWWKDEFNGQRFKEYFLLCHPELRPLLDPAVDGRELGEPQEMTAHNAVASSFGLRGCEYAPELES